MFCSRHLGHFLIVQYSCLSIWFDLQLNYTEKQETGKPFWGCPVLFFCSFILNGIHTASGAQTVPPCRERNDQGE